MQKLDFNNTEIAFQGKSKAEIKRAYYLFKLVNKKSLVSFGKAATDISLKLHLPINWLIKSTIFAHFCGGENIQECQKTINKLSNSNIGTILDYSVEGKGKLEDFERCKNEVIKTIIKAKGNSNIPFSVFKVSGIANIEVLEEVCSGKSLSENTKLEFEQIKNRMEEICLNAYNNNVQIFIDAEETCIQQAIDDIVLELMMKYNKERAIIFNTLQMYRPDRVEFLKQLYNEALNSNFKIGVKLVRGAYMEKERERAVKLGYPSPINTTKAETDNCYDEAVKFCIKHIDTISVCAATHNEKSSMLLANLMENNNIPKNHPNIYFAQLLGMSDHISYNLANAGYNVAKYVPYGPVKDVLPYLIRRAEENTSVAGQSSRELELIERYKVNG
ncbi:MAG: proline dehydrogenase family protein [Bacteroidota bacterium]